MKIISNELVKKIIEVNDLEHYISIVVDYDKEDKYAEMSGEIYDELSKEDFAPNDIEAIRNIIDYEAEEYYIYTADEALECIFPEEQNQMLWNAFSWIESHSKISWLCSFIFSEREYYDYVDNLNNNYIISRIPL